MKNSKFWGEICVIVLAPAIMAFGGLLMKLNTNDSNE